eukprot:scaffold2668_cov115-Isochrysis_galbana.AAC.19
MLVRQRIVEFNHSPLEGRRVVEKKIHERVEGNDGAPSAPAEVETESQTDECQAAVGGGRAQDLYDLRAGADAPSRCEMRDDRAFIVKTDGASTLGIGGVLTQKDDDGRERVVYA